MLILVDAPVAVPITAVVLASDPTVSTPVISSGQLVRLAADKFVVRLGVPLPSGAQVVVALAEGSKLAGRVIGEEADGVAISRDVTRASEERSGPRVAIRVAMRWRSRGADGPTWVRGGPDPAPFRSLRGRADVSVSGIRVSMPGPAPQLGATLLLDVVPLPERAGAPYPGAAFRAAGVVRRVEGSRSRPTVGIEFVDLPDATSDALAELTLRRL